MKLPITTSDDLHAVLSALANPHRLRIVAALSYGRNYVSQLAREIGMSRTLLALHLRRLEAAGLVVGASETSDAGTAIKYYVVAPFDVRVSPERIAAVVSLSSGVQPGRLSEQSSLGGLS